MCCECLDLFLEVEPEHRGAMGVWVGIVPTAPWAGGAVGRMVAKQVYNKYPGRLGWLLLIIAKTKVRESFMGLSAWVSEVE